jgi:PAS domain S-box-containing protein
MPVSTQIGKLIGDVLILSRESSGLGDLLSKSGQRMKVAFNADEVIAKDVSSRGARMSQADAAVINSGRPYVDNRLSDYSAFPELISFHKSGFKSCAIVPIKADGKGLGILTLVSKAEEAFDQQVVESVTVLADVIGNEAYLKIEKEKSLNVARYFDAAFNSILPQVLIDNSGSIIKANKGMLNLIDRPASEVSGRNMREFFSLSDDDLTSISRGAPVEAKSALYADRIFEITSSRASDRLIHLLLQDETEALELDEKAKLFDYGDEVYMLLDGNLKMLWASRNSKRILKTDPDALVGIRLTDMVSDPEELQRQAKSMPDGQITRRARLNLGNDLFADVKLTLLKNGAAYSCIISNDYERKINAAQRVAGDLVQFSGDIVIRMDKLGTISGINKAAERILGCRSQDMEGTSVSSLCADSESQNRISEAFALMKKSDSVTDMFLNMSGKGENPEIPVNMNLVGLLDENGNQAGYLGIGRELMTKVEMEELKDRLGEAEQLEKKLKAESDLKTQFIYNISHDLKTPLTSIKGYSKLMLQGEFGAISEDQKGSLETILGEVDRLMSLILQILDVAKLASGKIKLDIQQVSFNDIKENASVKALGERARNQGLEFEINVDYSVPEVPADPNRLIQVIVNLIDNALKFTAKGSIKVNVARKGKTVRVEVTDTGIGVKEDDQKKLFKKFYQVSRKDLTMQPKAGTGLGLSIVKEIVNLHGGRVGVTSEVGKGSTFWFTIPLEKKKKKHQQEDEKQQG